MCSGTDEELSPDERAIIHEEEALYRAVQTATGSASPAATPYFAHLRLHTKRTDQDVLLGYQAFFSRPLGVNIVDWRKAPIARVFFRYDEGEEYEEEVGNRVLEGKVEARRILTFDQGRLVQINTPGAVLRRGEKGQWGREVLDRWTEAGSAGSISPLFGTGATRFAAPPVSAMLDATQFRILEHDARHPLLILGSAGCGKTTVALHRLAALNRRNPTAHPEHEMAVIVPEGGLSRLIQAILRDLHLLEVQVFTFDDWISPNALRVFRDLPRDIRRDAPASVIRFKRHPAMRAAAQGLVRQLEAELAERLDRSLVASGRIARLFLECAGPSPLDRLHQVKPKALQGLSKGLRRAFLDRLVEEEEMLYRIDHDRLRLFGDSALLSLALDASSGTLTPGMMRDVLERTRLQFSLRTERAFAHVDAEQLKTVDGRLIDDGTPDELAGSVDVEDLPLLLELLRLKTGSMGTTGGSLTTYRDLVVDEAQDLTGLELNVLGHAQKAGGSLTVAGDEVQQIDPTSDFGGWDVALQALGSDTAHTVRLETSYRSPRSIVELAHHVLGPLAPEKAPRAVKEGPPVLRSVFRTEGHRAIALIEALGRLMDREPRAQIAIIARTPEQAARLHGSLSGHLHVRWVRDGEFEFRPGLDVTDVSQVKGLEFDYVVVPDASREHYPDRPSERRMLHVAVTRAVHQLWVMSIGEASPLLPPERPEPGAEGAELRERN